jgi:hypothetical protein
MPNMRTTDTIDPPQAVPGMTEPINVRMGEAIRLSGFSRSDLYRRAARGEVVFKKSGKSILIDYQSLKAAVAALPTATINVAQPQPSRKLITAPQRPGGKGSRSAARGRGARAAASA